MEKDRRVEMVQLELLEPGHLLIEWGDGCECLYSYRELRLFCACARCVDEWSGKPILKPMEVADDIRVTGWSRTGHYGIGLTFSDGHSTGIYTLKRLRELGEQEDRA